MVLYCFKLLPNCLGMVGTFYHLQDTLVFLLSMLPCRFQGWKNDTDMLAEAMCKLLTFPGTNTSLVYGIHAITNEWD